MSYNIKSKYERHNMRKHGNHVEHNVELFISCITKDAVQLTWLLCVKATTS